MLRILRGTKTLWILSIQRPRRNVKKLNIVWDTSSRSPLSAEPMDFSITSLLYVIEKSFLVILLLCVIEKSVAGYQLKALN